jgi:bilirubin oxidase
LLLPSVLPLCATAQIMNPMAMPPALDVDTFQLLVDEHVVQFYPGVSTNTYGASAPYLGPTLILHSGDTARVRVENQLAQVTSLHWHGMRVPGEFDGGPPREVAPGDHWDVKFQVKNPAGTFWYHPHPDGLTAEQASLGVAGFIIVQDTEEAVLDLPRTYGVDDFPIAIQDRRFAGNGNFIFGPFGDSVLVNGTPRAYLECPAQVVRLRLLNGSNARVYALGFDDGRDFHVIAGDGGLLNAPAVTDRLWLSNGERAEVLLDLTGMSGDSLLLMSFGSELPSTVPGGNNLAWESSVLNGVDFPVLRIRVTPTTSNPVTAVPTALVGVTPTTRPMPPTRAPRSSRAWAWWVWACSSSTVRCSISTPSTTRSNSAHWRCGRSRTSRTWRIPCTSMGARSSCWTATACLHRPGSRGRRTWCWSMQARASG